LVEHDKIIPLSIENLLLRGSSLKNTDWVIGLVVYAGHDTKIMKNSSSAKYKMSKIEKITNMQIIYIFCVQIILCMVAAMIATLWITDNLDEYWYLNFDTSDPWVTKKLRVFVKAAGTWQLIFT
jgi:phospholipid-transporting ATPase